MSEKISPCMVGDHITSETILREHFRAGGCVQVAGKEYWYRMPTTQLEMLCASSDEWVGSYRSLGELVRTDKVIACDVPALARQIGEAERYGREVEADDEQLRRDVGAPSISTNARRAGYIAPNGYRFPNGEELGAHLREGGHVIINGQGKWYRMRANLLEYLYRTGHEWQQSAWGLDDLARMETVLACDEPQLSKDIRAREEADAERIARKFTGRQMLYRDDESGMIFRIYNEDNRQVVFAMACGEYSQSRSLDLMEAAKLHAALGVWIDQASREEDQRFANNNSQRVLASSNNTEENGDAAALYQIRDAIHHLADTLFDGFNK